MTGIIERIGSLAGTEMAKAVNLAHGTFQSRMGVHNHVGRAVVETIAEVSRNHPNLVGIGVGLLVEQILVEEKHRHEAHALAVKAAEAAGAGAGAAEAAAENAEHGKGGEPLSIAPPLATAKSGGKRKANKPALRSSLHPPSIKLNKIKPSHVALDVFGALLLLKIGAAGARVFRRKRKTEVWFAPAARIHLLSATIAAYQVAAAIRSPRISAWRNAAIALFATDAIKPLLKHRPGDALAPLPPNSAPRVVSPNPLLAPATPAPAPAPVVSEDHLVSAAS